MSLLVSLILTWLPLLLSTVDANMMSSKTSHQGAATEQTAYLRESRDVDTNNEPPSTYNDSVSYRYTVIIDPENIRAQDDQYCFPPEGGVSIFPCRTLDFALRYYRRSSVRFLLVSPISSYRLTTDVTFINAENIAIIGNNDSYPTIPTIKCDESTNAGLAFLNSRNIAFRSVVITQCGAIRNSTSKNFSSSVKSTALCQFKVALYFSDCVNVELSHVRVMNSTQATGVVMYDTIGKVVVDSCEFTNNQVDGSRGYFGGGGFAVEFTYCQPGDNSCDNHNYNPFRHSNRNAQYKFTNSLFLNNTALGQSLKDILTSEYFILPLNATHEAFGRGGGLSVYFKGSASNNSIVINHCRFIHNQAVWGGGLLIEMDDNTINNTVVVSHCRFEQNSCNFTETFGTGGGALRIATTVFFWDFMYKRENVSRSIIKVEDCEFIQNRALEGGALSLGLARQGKSHPSQVTEISVSECTFQSNFGRIGSAADISLYQFFIDGYLSRVRFVSCMFMDNSMEYTKETTHLDHLDGLGTMYVNGITVDFSGTVSFLNNSGSALAVVGAQVDFSRCTALFVKNSGSIGGGIALLGVSLLIVGSQTRMTFTDNFVSGYGGAIYNRYIGQENMKSNINCFMLYEDPLVSPRDWNVEFYFKNNTAMKLGNSIFSSSILPCSLSRNKIDDVHKVFCWNKDRWIYNDVNECLNEIYTSPKNVTVGSTFRNIYPGKEFNLKLNAFDDLGHDVTRTTVYSALVYQQYPVKVANVDPRFAYIADNYVTINGLPDKNFTVRIETLSYPRIQIKTNMKLKRCPPGFVLHTQRLSRKNTFEVDGPNLICKCLNKNSYRGNFRCFNSDLNSQISTRFWIGFETDKYTRDNNNSDLLMGYFPPVYSLNRKKFNNHIIILKANSKKSVDEIICGDEHRTGVLCGKCVNDYAVAINSFYYECVLCNDTTRELTRQVIGYIALTYLPIVVLLFVIFYFNIKLTSSAASGFVLYAQMISSDIFNISGGKVSYLNVGSFPHIMQRMYRTVYGIFNLGSFANLLPSFCISKNFTTLDVICLDYVTAAFPLVVIIVVHFIYRYNLLRCKCSRKSNNKRVGGEISSTNTRSVLNGNSKAPKGSGKSLIHTFIAFILLSYTKFSIASMSSLYTTELFNAEGKTVSANRIYLAGHLTLSSSRFLFPYGLLAIFVFIFVVLLPPLLLLGPLQFIDWLIEKPKFHFLHKIWPSIAVHTFLDTFQGFYKPNRRFFAGVYFLFRLVLFLSYCFTRTTIQRYTIQQIVTSVMIVLISIFQPYKTNFFNHVDTLLFFNLAILNALALYFIANNTTADFSTVYAFECILVWLPFVYIVCYLVWSGVRNSKYYPTLAAMCLWISSWKKERESQPLLQGALLTRQDGMDYELTESFSDTDKGIFKRAEKKNMYRPTAVVNKTNKRKRVVETTVVSLTQYSSSEAAADCSAPESRQLELVDLDGSADNRLGDSNADSDKEEVLSDLNASNVSAFL